MGEMKTKEEKGRRFISIRVKFLLSLLLISALLIAAAAIISYRLTMDRVERIGMRLSGQYVISAGEDIRDKLHEIYKNADEIVGLKALHAMAELRKTELTGKEFLDLDAEIKRGVEAVAPLQSHKVSDVAYVAIYMKNGYGLELSNNQSFPFGAYEECLNYFIEAGATFSETEYDTPLWQICSVGGNNEYIPVYLRFIYEPVTLEKTGIIVLGLRNSTLRDTYIGYASKGYVLSTDGRILVAPISSGVGSSNDDTTTIIARLSEKKDSNGSLTYSSAKGEKKTVLYFRITSMKAYLIVPFAVEETDWESEMKSYVLAIVIISATLIAISIVLSFVISSGLTKSISYLNSFISKVEEGGERVRYTRRSNDEIGRLGEKLNSMLDELERIDRSRQEEMQLNQQMELQLMQQQINPHLLYNTLDSVLWGIEQRNYENAADVLKAVSEFFKISLSRGQTEIPLEDEVRMIENYMIIQNKARQKSFELVCDIPENLRKYAIIKLTLQPLVENSVVHGFAGYRDDGKVRVAARAEGGKVVISVEDNGIGMEPDEIEKMTAVLALPVCPKEHKHFGLYNIHRRIVQKYGEGYGLAIESEISEFTRISILLPLSNEMEME